VLIMLTEFSIDCLTVTHLWLWLALFLIEC